MKQFYSHCYTDSRKRLRIENGSSQLVSRVVPGQQNYPHSLRADKAPAGAFSWQHFQWVHMLLASATVSVSVFAECSMEKCGLRLQHRFIPEHKRRQPGIVYPALSISPCWAKVVCCSVGVQKTLSGSCYYCFLSFIVL